MGMEVIKQADIQLSYKRGTFSRNTITYNAVALHNNRLHFVNVQDGEETVSTCNVLLHNLKPEEQMHVAQAMLELPTGEALTTLQPIEVGDKQVKIALALESSDKNGYKLTENKGQKELPEGVEVLTLADFDAETAEVEGETDFEPVEDEAVEKEPQQCESSEQPVDEEQEETPEEVEEVKTYEDEEYPKAVGKENIFDVDSDDESVDEESKVDLTSTQASKLAQIASTNEEEAVVEEVKVEEEQEVEQEAIEEDEGDKSSENEENGVEEITEYPTPLQRTPPPYPFHDKNKEEEQQPTVEVKRKEVEHRVYDLMEIEGTTAVFLTTEGVVSVTVDIPQVDGVMDNTHIEAVEKHFEQMVKTMWAVAKAKAEKSGFEGKPSIHKIKELLNQLVL